LTRKIWIVLLPLALGMLACRALFPDAPAAFAGTPIPVATSQLEAAAFAAGQDFTLVRIYPGDGDLQAQLAAEVKKAQALGQRPFIEFDATWCPPCQAITTSLAARDALILQAYSGIYLIHVDVDEWGWEHSAASFKDIRGIPIFFALDSQGKPTGGSIDGGAWAADVPENIAPVLAKFFHP
jgi:thiol-disulfide isomerase/thioredoxin